MITSCPGKWAKFQAMEEKAKLKSARLSLLPKQEREAKCATCCSDIQEIEEFCYFSKDYFEYFGNNCLLKLLVVLLSVSILIEIAVFGQNSPISAISPFKNKKGMSLTAIAFILSFITFTAGLVNTN